VFTWRLGAAAVLAACVLAAGGGADEPKDKDKAKTDPPGAPVEAVLKVKKATYALDLGGKGGDEFKKLIAAGDDTGVYPPAPAVDLALELKNTGEKDIRLRVEGTQNVLDLDLQGPGAVTAALKRQITPKLIVASKTITLEPGKSYEIPITSLSFGFKGDHRAYWTEAGKYTLAASYKTALSPVPAGGKDGGDGFAPLTVTSAPAAIAVEAK
jgi:hypothetical protein